MLMLTCMSKSEPALTFANQDSSVFSNSRVKGGFPLSRKFYVRADVNFNWLYVGK